MWKIALSLLQLDETRTSKVFAPRFQAFRDMTFAKPSPRLQHTFCITLDVRSREL
jgi:hypothetical protein